MAFSSKIRSVGLVNLLFLMSTNSFFLTENSTEAYMSREERIMLKQEAVDMFYHAYRAYMNNAYPADELMPLSCKGRYRYSHPSRGNVDEALGNFSLTLIDSLDTLVILGDFDEFEKSVKLVIRDVTFNTDVVVSVFETNIRVLGGLLSGHVLSEVLKNKYQKMLWYRDELLDMAKDLGFRLLPAFNTTTGIPYSRVNLKYGIKQEYLELTRDTCTACAGTMILEMAALSRLTGYSIFEEKAHKTMDELWNLRHRTTNLMGTILNVHSGDWIRRDAGVGAGIDSYYEYLLKAYILLSDEKYLRRFNAHYSAVMTYVSQGPMLLDVHMHKPYTNTKNFMDALLAFWPGLQVLKGDLKPAIETHEMLYQVMQRHKFIPEAFTTDFQIHWGQHPLRPEFLESTYFLYRATGDHYYLHVGRAVLRSLQTYARVACGFASVKDVRTGAHEDSMDSFVLAETFKYLYLLFAEPSDVPFNLDDYLFTTEAHFLPLSISRYAAPKKPEKDDTKLELNENDVSRSCVLEKYIGHILRHNLRNMVDGICPQRKYGRRLYASQFQSYNKEHVKILNDMGITVAMLPDGKMQLVHNYVAAASKTDANEGLLFMQEMIELSRSQNAENSPQSVTFITKNKTMLLSAGPANFGKLLRGDDEVTGLVEVAVPLKGCTNFENAAVLKGRIGVVERGECMFIDKARKLQNAGAVGGIIIDNIPDSSSESWPIFAMSGDGTDDVTIPVVFLFSREAKRLLNAAEEDPTMNVSLAQLKTDKTGSVNSRKHNFIDKLDDSVKGISYKPDYYDQELLVINEKFDPNVQSIRISSSIETKDDILIKGTTSNNYPISYKENYDSHITRTSYTNTRREQTIQDFFVENIRQRLHSLLQRALKEPEKNGKHDKEKIVLSDQPSKITEDEMTQKLLDIGREYLREIENFNNEYQKYIKTREQEKPKCEDENCTPSMNEETTEFQNVFDRLFTKFENFSQSKFDAVLSLIEEIEYEKVISESVKDVYQLAEKYKKLFESIDSIQQSYMSKAVLQMEGTQNSEKVVLTESKEKEEERSES